MVKDWIMFCIITGGDIVGKEEKEKEVIDEI